MLAMKCKCFRNNMLRLILLITITTFTANCFVIENSSLGKEGCILNIQKKDPEPIIVNERNQMLYPTKEGIELNVGDIIRIGCPGSKLKSLGAVSTTASCVSGSKLEINGKSKDFKSITCTGNITNVARYTGEKCAQKLKEIEIGFDLGDGNFARIIQVCFDDESADAVYAYHIVTKHIAQHEAGVARPYFIEDKFYHLKKKVNALYTRQMQRITINKQLGLPESSTKYVKNGGSFYLARGHLSPKAAFTYSPEQSATFHYVNVAPQWQSFNGQNWMQVEASVRYYADRHFVDLHVYTGTYGHCTLPDEETGEETPLYLYVDDDKKALAVPGLYWKIVYEPVSQKGVALIGVNNPYITSVDDHVICKDVSDKLDWVRWEKDNIEHGYSYACEIKDFTKRVKYLPSFDVKGLLV